MGPDALLQSLTRVVTALDGTGIRFAVAGGLAVYARGAGPVRYRPARGQAARARRAPLRLRAPAADRPRPARAGGLDRGRRPGVGFAVRAGVPVPAGRPVRDRPEGGSRAGTAAVPR